jgi:hypothetical protein
MMKKQIIIIMALLVGFVMPTMAQSKNQKVEDRIQLAREKYADGLALISANGEDEYPLNYTTVVRRQNWAAIGEKVEKMDFYYHEIEEEENPYPVGYTLRMVRYAYNIAARDYLEEYIFDDNEKPLFFFTHFVEILNSADYSTEFEVRYYYDENGKVIRSIFKLMDENGKMKEITSKSHPEVVKELDEITSPSFDYVKKIFDAIY